MSNKRHFNSVIKVSKYIWILCSLFFSISLWAQKVYDIDTNEPITNAYIYEKNRPWNITLSDSLGRFELNADPGDTLIVSHIRYETQLVILSNKFPNKINLKENIASLDEVVVTTLSPRKIINRMFDSWENHHPELSANLLVKNKLTAHKKEEFLMETNTEMVYSISGSKERYEIKKFEKKQVQSELSLTELYSFFFIPSLLFWDLNRPHQIMLHRSNSMIKFLKKRMQNAEVYILPEETNGDVYNIVISSIHCKETNCGYFLTIGKEDHSLKDFKIEYSPNYLYKRFEISYKEENGIYVVDNCYLSGTKEIDDILVDFEVNQTVLDISPYTKLNSDKASVFKSFIMNYEDLEFLYNQSKLD